ncbi:unnamed protein product [Blepharisma stoltei]|uniref:Uncharacterized protein n=1 Tax=Blepharisma stoltei TaxID=1481888 RepID=A0AAU9JR58_9CILI|nr:unnamed protein product [Blepharisma stoltei]
MEIEYLNIINYNYKIEAMEYLSQMNYLQDIGKSMGIYSWHLNCEKLENIIKRSGWLCEEEVDNDCGIYHSEAMTSIDMDEIDNN